jgi:integrase/recombinase XerD
MYKPNISINELLTLLMNWLCVYIPFFIKIFMENTIADFIKILELKRYSRSTIGSYKSHLGMVKGHFKNKTFQEIRDEELFEFVYDLVMVKNISASYQRQIIGALKLFYQEIYNRSITFEYLTVSRREKKLPVVLSKSEVKKIIQSITNLKHKALIALLYGSGLRIGELLKLKKMDIDSDRMAVYVRSAKGKKDRYTILSKNVLELLRSYYLKYKPIEYLFEGQSGGSYSRESAAQVLLRALKRARINKHATLHTLRHSFATHLLEDGIGIANIQKLLGHNNINTTLIYTQIARDTLLQIKSPLDT